MNNEDRIIQLENKVNILSLDMQNIKNDFTHIKINIDLLVNNLIKKDDNKIIEDKKNNEKKEKMQESFADV